MRKTGIDLCVSREDAHKLRALTVPIPLNEGARLEILRDTNILDSNVNDPEFDRFSSLCGRIFGLPIVHISFVDVDRSWFKSKIGIEEQTTCMPRDVSFCSYTILEESPDVYVISDTTLNPLFQNNPVVTGPLNIRFYAGASIVIDGAKIGTVCVLDVVSHFDFDISKKMTLLDIASLISSFVAKRRTGAARLDRERGRLMTSMTHNLKTPISVHGMNLSMVANEFKSLVNGNDQSSILGDSLKAVFDSFDRLQIAVDTSCHLGQLVAGAGTEMKTPKPLDVAAVVSRCQERLDKVDTGCLLTWKVDDSVTVGDFSSFPDIFELVLLSFVVQFGAERASIDIVVHFVEMALEATTPSLATKTGVVSLSKALLEGFIVIDATLGACLDCCPSSQQEQDFACDHVLRDIGGMSSWKTGSDKQILLSPETYPSSSKSSFSRVVRGLVKNQTLISHMFIPCTLQLDRRELQLVQVPLAAASASFAEEAVSDAPHSPAAAQLCRERSSPKMSSPPMKRSFSAPSPELRAIDECSPALSSISSLSLAASSALEAVLASERAGREGEGAGAGAGGGSSPAQTQSTATASDLPLEPPPRIFRVLIVEDSIAVQKTMSRWLFRNGCDVTCAINGKLGLGLLSAEKFDIVFCDFLMPVMDGLTMMKEYQDFLKKRAVEASGGGGGGGGGGGAGAVVGAGAGSGVETLLIGMSATAVSTEQDVGFAYGMHLFGVKPVNIVFFQTVLDAMRNGYNTSLALIVKEILVGVERNAINVTNR
jgi:CheY-like chemotaxis protein